MYAGTIFQFRKSLKNLDQFMNKAAAYADAKKFDVNILANSRLAPDMFPFIRQVQSACDAAKFCAAYLTEQQAPKHEDVETTWKELHERIQKAVNYLDTFSVESFERSAKVQVKPGWAKGQWLTAEDYVNEVAIPNFYFHLTTAYAILRHSGVDVGKMDFLGTVSMKGEKNA